mmetsp:Transcript_34454/g.72156  ORF Transcript_34454/g.72156 Transcript_34454/m.72156 type:complete len:242 (-) Transcript_34454:517-1242(-)
MPCTNCTSFNAGGRSETPSRLRASGRLLRLLVVVFQLLIALASNPSLPKVHLILLIIIVITLVLTLLPPTEVWLLGRALRQHVRLEWPRVNTVRVAMRGPYVPRWLQARLLLAIEYHRRRRQEDFPRWVVPENFLGLFRQTLILHEERLLTLCDGGPLLFLCPRVGQAARQILHLLMQALQSLRLCLRRPRGVGKECMQPCIGDPGLFSVQPKALACLPQLSVQLGGLRITLPKNPLNSGQ